MKKIILAFLVGGMFFFSNIHAEDMIDSTHIGAKVLSEADEEELSELQKQEVKAYMDCWVLSQAIASQYKKLYKLQDELKELKDNVFDPTHKKMLNKEEAGIEIQRETIIRLETLEEDFNLSPKCAALKPNKDLVTAIESAIESGNRRLYYNSRYRPKSPSWPDFLKKKEKRKSNKN